MHTHDIPMFIRLFERETSAVRTPSGSIIIYAARTYQSTSVRSVVVFVVMIVYNGSRARLDGWWGGAFSNTAHRPGLARQFRNKKRKIHNSLPTTVSVCLGFTFHGLGLMVDMHGRESQAGCSGKRFKTREGWDF